MKRFWLASSANEHSPSFLSRDVVYAVAAAIWLVLVAFGLGFLMRYAREPGDPGNVVTSWPIESRVRRSDSKPTLMVFAHPKCPCTAATLEELSWIMARCTNKVDCHVLFFQAEGEGPDWVKTSNWRTASAIEGVNVWSDPQSRCASRFGVRTSGHAILYDRHGHLAFEGGITPSRGHRGDNAGRTALLSLIRGGSVESLTVDQPEASVDSTCVFGCPLHAPEVAARRRPTSGEG